MAGGRIRFDPANAKGRKERKLMLPESLFACLKAQCGEEWLWESFPDQLRSALREKGLNSVARRVGPFAPGKVRYWFEKTAEQYFEETRAPKFKLHNLRGTAMNRARLNGVNCDDAAIAFGCHPETMRAHYLSLDEVGIADKVMLAIAG